MQWAEFRALSCAGTQSIVAVQNYATIDNAVADVWTQKRTMIEATVVDTGEGDHELAAVLHGLEHGHAVPAQHRRRDERHQLEQQVRLRPALRRQVPAERGLERLRRGRRDDIPASVEGALHRAARLRES